MTERLETYGSAFRDPAKGSLDEALSQRQSQVVRTLDKKGRARTKPEAPGSKSSDAAGGDTPRKHSSFKRKTPARSPRGRDIHEDVPEEASEAPLQQAKTAPGRPRLRVIPGGKDS
ncbi:MAG: hypothetical protein GC155_07425 [Alphaproteobacteria bacterium]|nr:hypothetical protein [Alphaproteobacteria bacterium]